MVVVGVVVVVGAGPKPPAMMNPNPNPATPIITITIIAERPIPVPREVNSLISLNPIFSSQNYIGYTYVPIQKVVNGLAISLFVS